MLKPWRQPHFPHPGGGITRIKPLADYDILNLLELLGLTPTEALVAALSDAFENAVSDLESAVVNDPEDMAERRAELERIAADPARALEAPPSTRPASHARSFLLYLAEVRGIDPETRRGAVQIGDLARARLARKSPGKPTRIKEGEFYVLKAAWHALSEIAPDKMTLPGEAYCNNGHPVIEFVEEFIYCVVDRVRLMVPPNDADAHKQLKAVEKRPARTTRDRLVAIKSASNRRRPGRSNLNKI